MITWHPIETAPKNTPVIVVVPIPISGEWFFGEATFCMRPGTDRAMWWLADQTFEDHSVAEIVGQPVGWMPAVPNLTSFKTQFLPPEVAWASQRAPRARSPLAAAMNRVAVRLQSYWELVAGLAWSARSQR